MTGDDGIVYGAAKQPDEGPRGALPAEQAYTAAVVCHNAERTLAQALRHLSALEPAAAKIVVVDDASDDRSAAIARRHPGVELVESGTNRGPAASRNEAAKRVVTPWILFVDADCYVHAEGFRRAMEMITEEPELDGVMGVFEPDAPSGPVAGRFKNFYRRCEIEAMDNPPHVFTSSCFLVRRATYESLGGFTESFGSMPTEDNEFYFRLLKTGGRIKYSMAFSFMHDKPMGIAQLLREDAARVEAIVLNLRGRLGARRYGYQRGERLLAAAELVGSLTMLVALPAIVLGFLIDRGAVSIVAIVFLAALLLLAVINTRVLRRAVVLRGPWFAVCVLWYRALEMVAAGLGAARGILTPRKAPVPADEAVGGAMGSRREAVRTRRPPK